ncbi:helix-turn-helix domain-containing protein [Streptomyces hainanensis]|uniref:XRE family transcriptional regulator n=1 Tax=Streptomyces hainanensis TaxID=402648 RepID=A0A4R4TA42_9ACTN|nr:helix-turn-helix transcriptional regulator [Streptomyces hainanensis]TDC74010.1 XRE family transcriptional regulator [Streptomyces hainanensis]
MGLRTNPTQRQRRLGLELRRLREPTGLSAAEAGEHIGVGRAYLSNIEAGRTHVSADKVRLLTELYGCTGERLVEGLVAMAESDGRGWWSDFRQSVNPALLDLIELEDSATTVRTFHWLYVPGLLQTAEYTRELFRTWSGAFSSESLERYAEIRRRRQGILVRDDPPTYHAIIHEGVFRMGFIDRKVMGDQIEYLIEAARSPHITLQLVPFSAPANPSARGAFTVYDAGSPELRTVNLDQPTSMMFLTDQSQLEEFTAHFARLARVALAPLDPGSAPGEGSSGLAQYLLYSLKETIHGRP